MGPSPPGSGSLPPSRRWRRSLGVELSPVDARDAPEIERAVTAFAGSGDGGLIVTPGPVANRHRKLIHVVSGKAKRTRKPRARPSLLHGALLPVPSRRSGVARRCGHP
jgi:hypothetical protein